MDTYLPKDFDLGRFMFDEAHKALTADGRVRAVIAAYERALEDERTVIPSALHAAIEALRRG